MSLTNTQYNTIMRRYEARQLENQHILQQRILEVQNRCPEWKELEDSISSLSVSKARLLLDGNDSALQDLKQELHTLISKKQRMLNEAGFPADYLTPPYKCSDCQDTGYIGNRKCHCFRQASLDLVYSQSNMHTILEQENFNHFSLEYYSQDEIDPATGVSSQDYARSAFTTCRSFVENFDKEFNNLLIYGDTGVGKTFLSNCVAKELLDTEHSVIYFTTFELFHLFKQAAFQNDANQNEDYQNLFECDLLIIDDLGTELVNSFTTSQLFICLNERILRKKSTIISTNLNLPQLAELYSERIFSRITSCYTIIKMFGVDIRVQKKLKGN